MKFGLHLERKAPAGHEPRQMFDDIVQQVRTARESGFDLISTGQHFLFDDLAMLQTIPLLSRLTNETGSMTVATNIMILPLLNPIEVAENIATLDVMNDGDVIAGVGGGYRQEEFDSFGISKSERGPRVIESIQLMNSMWTQDDVHYDGDYYSVEGVSTKLRPADKPDVWLAANSRGAVERAAEISDGWLANPHSTISEIAQHKEAYDEIREKNGENADIPLFRECFVGKSREHAEEIAGEYLAEKYGPDQYLKWGQDQEMEDTTELHQSFDELAKDRFILGSPAEVCERIENLQNKIGLNYLILRVQWPGLPNRHVVDCLERIGDEVIPNL